ncbi:MAG: bifunctional oligoribonuclease/PAP phosphatase NrnA [Clostridia bacterium]|nr:bifunctional oligoribonuclease/PAP phosphatase NrnA [Clostridia bacterium]
MRHIIEMINSANKIALITHTKPDPDAIGSVWALYFALKQLNKKVSVFFEEPLPKIFDYLEPVINDVYYNGTNLKDNDLIIALDIANTKLLGKLKEPYVKFKNSVCIDHHPMRKMEAGYEFVVDNACATTEILYDLFFTMEIKITKQIANCIYTGIVGDTGRFLYSNTNAKTFKMAYELAKNNADINFINTILMNKITKELAKGIKILFSNLDFRGNILFSTLSLKDYKIEKISPVSSADLIGYLTDIENIDIFIVLNEKSKNKISASLRSNNKYDISIVAKQFGGGGHKQASGLQEMIGDIGEVKENIYKYISNNLQSLIITK